MLLTSEYNPENFIIRSQAILAVARIADCTSCLTALWCHVTLSVTWPCDTPYVISYRWSFGTESLNPAVFEILRSKRIGVTSLTFQCHETSSVTWPFDSQKCAISYWWSFGTKPLSLSVSEIFNVECNAVVDVTSKQRSRPFILVPIDFSYRRRVRVVCQK